MSATAGRDAHAFLEQLSDAIGAVVGDLDGGPLRYRGLDLGPAVARHLFVELSNDASLAAGVPGARRVPTRAQARVRARLADTAAAPTALRRARAALAGERVLGRQARPTATPPAPRALGGVVFVVEHPKFLGLVGRVADAVGSGQTTLLWTAASVRPPDRPADPALDEFAIDGRSSLRHAGWAVREMPDMIAEAERFAAAIARLQPRHLVICEGNSPHGAVAAAAARAADVPVTCLQQGWSPIVHAGFRAIPADRMCVWGEGFAELLRPYNPRLDFVVTGSPMLEARGGVSAPLAALVAGRPAVGFFLQPLSPYIRPADQRAVAELAAAVAQAAPHALLLLRPHPGYPLEATKQTWPENVAVAGGDRFGLREVIEASRGCVSIYSTSLIEGAALGRPAIAFNPTDLPRYLPDLEALGAGRETADPAAAAQAIVELLGDASAVSAYAPGMALVRERYFAGLQAGAAQRAAEALT